LIRQAVIGLLALFAVMAVLLFGGAGTVDWWQAWLFLAVYFGASLGISLYLMRKDPALLARRMRGGPWAEKRPAQQLIMLIACAGFIGLIVVPALDKRLGWSHMAPAIVIVGNVLMALGWLGTYFVFRENSFTAATIERAPDQRVISTGPYAVVRHPMYSSVLVMLLGMPIALGSWWGVLALLVMGPALILRIFDEEKFLVQELPGYAEYKQKVRYRLIPHLW
jgi:protein-S-isoprenylcysteine O-methyltransferase Ste14